MKISKNISRVDRVHKNRFPFSFFQRVRYKILNYWLAEEKKQFWEKELILKEPEVHKIMTSAILEPKPFAVARLGGVEASLVMWAKQIPKFSFGKHIPRLFSDTAQGATNAGIRPRNKESYKAFADLAWDSLKCLDLQGVWVSGFEAAYLSSLPNRVLYNVETIGPNGVNPSHWVRALVGKRVLVISPFANTIHCQIPKLAHVWPDLPWLAYTDFDVIQFPYLIDDDCPEAWWEVYGRIGQVISAGNYDVALLGCGGLGLPFAALAKKSGRIGIHLGGHLQLLFGIYGQRHLNHEWHRKHINDSWVRPDLREVAKSANRVEGGCYW